MKRYALFLVILLVATISFAESVWTGNAAVGGTADFPGDSDTYRASSNSFPPGTMVKVTNPRGGSSVDVIITGRLDSPGVFILLEEQAGTSIGLPLDHVIPVRVTPYSEEEDTEIADAGEREDGSSDDSDFNPAVSIEEDDEELKTAEISEPQTVDAEAIAEESSVAETVEDPVPAETMAAAAVALPQETDEEPEVVEDAVADEEVIDEPVVDEAVVEEDPVGTPSADIVVADEPAPSPETIIAYEYPEDTDPVPDETSMSPSADTNAAKPFSEAVVEEDIVADLTDDTQPTADEPDSEPAPVETPFEDAAVEEEPTIVTEEEMANAEEGDSIYFLMPSEPKPPESAADPDETASSSPVPVDEPPEAITESDVPADMGYTLARADRTASDSYVQIGAYRSLAVMREAAGKINRAAPGYPLKYVEAGSSNARIYKLLIGPLQPAEVGIVLQTARNTAFPDAFPYAP